MTFIIRHFRKLREFPESEQIKGMIDRYGDEFVPSLKLRSSPLEQHFKDAGSNDGSAYFAMLGDHPVLVMYEQGIEGLVGFMSYVSEHVDEHLRGYNPSNYVSTVIIDQPFRGRGAGMLMYKYLIKHVSGSTFTTRTWSTNFAHIRPLERMGFNRVTEIRDHRGSDIHTVYYGLAIENQFIH